MKSEFNNVKRKRLNAITGIKVLLVLLVFTWHAFSTDNFPRYGARCCDFLFVISGFLVAYNDHMRFTGSFSQTISYLSRKIKSFYPVYLIGLVLTVMIMCLQYGGISWVDRDAVISFVWNLFLLQAWFPDIAMSYNGLAWFLSALLFCYAISPLISTVFRMACERFGALRGEGFMLLCLIAVRFFLDQCYLLDNGATYNFNLYTSPLVRAFDYSIAYVVGVWFTRFSAGQNYSFSLCTLLEVLSVIVTVFLVFRFDSIWQGSYYTLCFLAPTVIFAIGGGAISRILSASCFRTAATIETEFYLLHQIPLKLLWIVFPIFNIHGEKKTAFFALILTIALCVVCRFICLHMNIFDSMNKRKNA